MVPLDFGSVVFFVVVGDLLAVGADLASAVSVAVSLTVTVGFGSAVVAVPPPEPPMMPPMMPPRPSATTAVMIKVGQPNLFGFFGCC